MSINISHEALKNIDSKDDGISISDVGDITMEFDEIRVFKREKAIVIAFCYRGHEMYEYFSDEPNFSNGEMIRGTGLSGTIKGRIL